MKRLLWGVAVVALTLMVSHVPADAFQEVATIQIPNLRFYSVKAVHVLRGGSMDLLAAGQIDRDYGHDGLVAAFSMENGRLRETAREVFRVASKGNTRIRSLIHMRVPGQERSLVVVNGKGGPENQETGFIRSYGFDGKAFHPVDSIAFSDPETPYTHGYPLIRADVDRDGKDEIVYGGFSGEHDRDRADIRIFSVKEGGRLSPLKGFQTDRLKNLRLRVNALTSGDIDGDGRIEIVAAGRTVEKDMEHAAFALFSEQDLLWKQVSNLGMCRYRHATITDMPGGKPALVLAGRIQQGDTLYALLDVWQEQGGEIELVSRYRYTGAGATRLRLVEPLPASPGRLLTGGRTEVLENGRLRWQGFLQEVSLESGILSPFSKPILLDLDWETRVRAVDVLKSGLLTGGFTEAKGKASAGFISVYRLK
jgi:hypothetical protein